MASASKIASAAGSLAMTFFGCLAIASGHWTGAGRGGSLVSSDGFQAIGTGALFLALSVPFWLLFFGAPTSKKRLLAAIAIPAAAGAASYLAQMR